jgi:hypothetical protein
MRQAGITTSGGTGGTGRQACGPDDVHGGAKSLRGGRW